MSVDPKSEARIARAARRAGAAASALRDALDELAAAAEAGARSSPDYEGMAEDIAVYDAAVAEGAREYPLNVVGRVFDGEPPVRVFREWRGLTQAALAARARLSKGYVSDIEGGRKSPPAHVLRALADALDVDIDVLVPPANVESKPVRRGRGRPRKSTDP